MVHAGSLSLTPDPADPADSRPALHVAFTRSQIASAIATGVDFSITSGLVLVVSVWPVVATGVGAFLGAVTHFALGRAWSFRAFGGPVARQIVRYAGVALGSLLLNSGGLWMLSALGGWRWFPAKVVASLCVGLFFNFPLHRWFVFR